MRLKSAIFVSALLRQSQSRGGFCMVLNKGAEEAGAIFVIHEKGSGKADLYGPAPQALLDSGHDGERLFEKLLEDASQSDISDKLEKQKRFDPDCWIVEVELRDKMDFLPVAGDTR